MDASLDVSCVLCPTTLPNKKRPSPRNLKGPAPDFDFLHVVRPTEGYKWVHVLCATYTRQCKFSDWERLRPVEGIMDITSFDDQSCLFCDEVGGAIVSCRKCPETFHASCGWLSGCSFGFEVHQVGTIRTRCSHDPCSAGPLSPLAFKREAAAQSPQERQTAQRRFFRLARPAHTRCLVQSAQCARRSGRRIPSCISIA